MGYCPQPYALLKTLNAYEHLSIFARIRGIPKENIQQEVEKWIDRLR